MYRHDYILRLIERFGRALTALRDRLLRRTAEADTAEHEIQEIAAAAGLDLGVARGLDPAMLLMWLAPGGTPDPGRLWLMAELLYLEGLRGMAAGAPVWRGDLERAVVILESLPPEWRPGEPFASAGERVSEIRGHLSGRAE
jgi:hypothetical protein